MTRSVLLSAFVCGLLAAACSRPTGSNGGNAPANTPAPQGPTVPHERAYVVSCAPTADNKGLTWFESGSDVPFSAEALPKHIETLAKAGGNWNAKEERSENRIALRIDARASVAEFWRFVDALLAARVYKLAIAMLQEFDSPFHKAGGGEAKWELDERYLKLEFPTDEGLDRPGPVVENGFSLGLNLLWSTKFSRCTLQTVYERDVRQVAEIEPLFSDLLPAAAEGKTFKRGTQGVYSFATKLGEEALEKAAKACMGNLSIVEIGETNRALAPDKRHAPAEHPPVTYLFLALDSIQRLNASRRERGLEPVAVRFTYGAAKGRRLDGTGVAPVPPEPEIKPVVKPWGDPPGEMFEPRAAFTVVIEQFKRGEFAYFWGRSPKPRTWRDFGEEIASFAKQRDVKGGHPGWEAAKKVSGNVLAIRCDIEAPYSFLLALMEQGYEAGIRRFALAARGAFDATDYIADEHNNRPLLKEISASCFRFDMDDELNSSGPKERVDLYVAYDSKEQAARTTVAIGARGRRDIEGSLCTLADISPELAGDDAGRKLAEVRRRQLIEAVAAKLENYIRDTGARIEKLAIHAGSTAWRPNFDTPCGFLLVMIEAAQEVNSRRRLAEKPALEISIWNPAPVPPEPEMKPPKQTEFPKDEPRQTTDSPPSQQR